MVEERVPSQTISESVNKSLIIGFKISTIDGSSTSVISKEDVAARGGAGIRDVHLKCTGANGYLGLGREAMVLSEGDAEENIVPIFQNAFFDKENLCVAYVKVIRATDTNLTVEGFVVVN